MIRAGAADLQARIEALFPSNVAVALSNPCAPQPDLWTEEAHAVRHAVPKRRREFAAGRAAVREAMRTLGMPDLPVPMGAKREPLWPEGITGSISHTASCCVAVLARVGTASALGIDLEPDEALDHNLIPEICRPEEQEWARLHADPARETRLIFSAKESVYKGQYGLTGTVLGFDDLSVVPDVDTGTYRATFQRRADPFDRGQNVEGRFLRHAGLIVTTCWFRAEADQHGL